MPDKNCLVSKKNESIRLLALISLSCEAGAYSVRFNRRNKLVSVTIVFSQHIKMAGKRREETCYIITLFNFKKMHMYVVSVHIRLY